MNEYIARQQMQAAADSDWVRFEVRYSLLQPGSAIPDKDLKVMQEEVSRLYERARALLGNAK